MKIAKKVLAVVMAIAMIGCLTAMAFAAGTPGVKLVPGKIKEDGSVQVSLVLVNSTGLTSFKYTITADDALTPVANSDDPNTVKLTKGAIEKVDSTMITMNINNGELGGLFQGGLLTADKYKEIAEENEVNLPDGFSDENAELTKINYKLASNFTGGKISVVGDIVVNGENLTVKADCIVGTIEKPEDKKEDDKPAVDPEKKDDKKEDDKPAVDPEKKDDKKEDTKKEDPKPVIEEPSDNPNVKKQVEPKAGDNMALAAAAGVVALAGAAFIISKKRK